jgi:type VI secretion system lysozyme-related protein
VAALTPQERLQPALLDRLIDDDPSSTVEPREQRVLTKARLREAVLRDLSWLFNATRPSDDIDWEQWPHAAQSVLNYGLPALSGETASTLDIVQLENEVKRTILTFEPRIMPATLKVEALVSELQMDHHNVVSLHISGHLWAQPVPLEFLLRTELDLETGQVQVRELRG